MNYALFTTSQNQWNFPISPAGGEGYQRDGDDGENVDDLSHGVMFYITGNLADLQVMSTEDSQDRSDDRHVNTKH